MKKTTTLILATVLSGSVHADFVTIGNRLYTIDLQSGKSSRVDLDEEAERKGTNKPMVRSSNLISVDRRLFAVDPRTGRTTRLDLDEKYELRGGSRPLPYP